MSLIPGFYNSLWRLQHCWSLTPHQASEWSNFAFNSLWVWEQPSSALVTKLANTNHLSFIPYYFSWGGIWVKMRLLCIRNNVFWKLILCLITQNFKLSLFTHSTPPMWLNIKSGWLGQLSCAPMIISNFEPTALKTFLTGVFPKICIFVGGGNQYRVYPYIYIN